MRTPQILSGVGGIEVRCAMSRVRTVSMRLSSGFPGTRTGGRIPVVMASLFVSRLRLPFWWAFSALWHSMQLMIRIGRTCFSKSIFPLGTLDGQVGLPISSGEASVPVTSFPGPPGFFDPPQVAMITDPANAIESRHRLFTRIMCLA